MYYKMFDLSLSNKSHVGMAIKRLKHHSTKSFACHLCGDERKGERESTFKAVTKGVIASDCITIRLEKLPFIVIWGKNREGIYFQTTDEVMLCHQRKQAAVSVPLLVLLKINGICEEKKIPIKCNQVWNNFPLFFSFSKCFSDIFLLQYCCCDCKKQFFIYFYTFSALSVALQNFLYCLVSYKRSAEFVNNDSIYCY